MRVLRGNKMIRRIASPRPNPANQAAAHLFEKLSQTTRHPLLTVFASNYICAARRFAFKRHPTFTIAQSEFPLPIAR